MTEENQDNSVTPLPKDPAEETVTKSNNSICAKCGHEATTFCRRCGQDFCASHKCIMHAEEFTTKDTPLTDEEGVTHQGRHIQLIGEGWPNVYPVKDMSDDELRTQIAGLQALLQDAIRTGDYARISIAAREFELDYREHSRYVAAVKRREKIQQGAVRVNGKAHRVSSGIPSDIAHLMKAFGLTREKAEAMKILLGGKK